MENLYASVGNNDIGHFLQEFGFTDIGELQFEEDLCLDVSSSRVGAHIQILNCHSLGGNQKWEYNNKVCRLVLY